MLALQIAGGIWLGVMLLACTFWVGCQITERVQKANRRGDAWWSDLLPAR